MSLRIPIRFEGSKGEKILYTLFDGGATYSCISDDSVKKLEDLLKLRTPMKLSKAGKESLLEITHATCLDFYPEEIRLSDEFLVVPGLSEDAIIGSATMQKWRIKLDVEHDKVIVDPSVSRPILINLIKKN